MEEEISEGEDFPSNPTAVIVAIIGFILWKLFWWLVTFVILGLLLWMAIWFFGDRK